MGYPSMEHQLQHSHTLTEIHGNTYGRRPQKSFTDKRRRYARYASQLHKNRHQKGEDKERRNDTSRAKSGIGRDAVR